MSTITCSSMHILCIGTLDQSTHSAYRLLVVFTRQDPNSPSALHYLLIDTVERLLAVGLKGFQNILSNLSQVCPSDTRCTQSDICTVGQVIAFLARPVQYVCHLHCHRGPKPSSKPILHLGAPKTRAQSEPIAKVKRRKTRPSDLCAPVARSSHLNFTSSNQICVL